MKKCPNCRREIEENSVFCEYCGCKIKRSKKPLWIALAAVAFMIIVGAVIVVMNVQHETEIQELKSEYRSNDEMESRIHSFIEDYSRLTETSNRQLIDELVSKLFAPAVKRYFNAYDTNADYVADCFFNYDNRFGVYGKHSSVRWNTVSYSQSGDRIFLTYIEDFSIDRKDKSKYSVFELEKHFELNKSFQVVSVYDVQLSKSKK